MSAHSELAVLDSTANVGRCFPLLPAASRCFPLPLPLPLLGLACSADLHALPARALRAPGSAGLLVCRLAPQCRLLLLLLQVTAILEAGRISLNHGGAAVAIEFDDKGLPCALKVAA